MTTNLDYIAQIQIALDGLKQNNPPQPVPFYTACTDRIIRPKPQPLALGPAGFAFKDPTYGTPMWRLTDEHTDNGSPLRVPSNTGSNAWACDSSKILLMNGGGSAKVFAFDNGQATLTDLVAGGGNVEPTFSYKDPNLIWGCWNHTVSTWRFNVRTPVFNLQASYPNLPFQSDDEPNRDYVGGLVLADKDAWAVYWGGGTQDHHIYVHHSGGSFLDTSKLPIPFRLHGVGMDRTGRFVFLVPITADQPAAGVVLFWDTQTGVIAKVTRLPAGHGCLGYDHLWVNQDCCSGGVWDGRQWQIRDVTKPTETTDLIMPVPTPLDKYFSDHSSWRAAQPGQRIPFVSATYRHGEALLHPELWPWGVWDDELIAVSTDGSGIVYRFCHTQSVILGYDDQPNLNVNPTGEWVLFHTNFGNTVGAGRQDVFLVSLR